MTLSLYRLCPDLQDEWSIAIEVLCGDKAVNVDCHIQVYRCLKVDSDKVCRRYDCSPLILSQHSNFVILQTQFQFEAL